MSLEFKELWIKQLKEYPYEKFDSEIEEKKDCDNDGNSAETESNNEDNTDNGPEKAKDLDGAENADDSETDEVEVENDIDDKGEDNGSENQPTENADTIDELLSTNKIEENFEIKTYKKDKQIKEFTYFSKKEFENFSGEYPTKIIGNVNFRKKYKEKDTEEEKERYHNRDKIIGKIHFYFKPEFIDKHPNKTFNSDFTKEFCLYESKSTNCIGFLYVGDTSFVRIEKSSPVLLIFVAFLIMALALSIHAPIDNTDKIKPGGEDDDGKGNPTQDLPEQEYIEIPTYQDLKITKDNPYIRLRNPSGNTVNFIYKIYIDEDKDSFVDTIKTKPLYETLLIQEGKSVDVSLKSLLKNGDYVLYIVISCFDSATNAACDGSVLPNVRVTVS